MVKAGNDQLSYRGNSYPAMGSYIKALLHRLLLKVKAGNDQLS